MKGIKFRPVAWLTGTCTLVIALAGAQEVYAYLPPKVAGALTFAAALSTVVLGWATHNAVTPLARPRDTLGRRLTVDVADRCGPACSEGHTYRKGCALDRTLYRSQSQSKPRSTP